MKKRILSMLLALCMVLMLVPATAFADEGYYTITQNFKYGTLFFADDIDTQQTSPYTKEVKKNHMYGLGTVIDCAPYKFVGWRETGSGTIYAAFAALYAESNLNLEAVYEVDGSLAITVDGFEVGKTPDDCTYTFDSTIPGVTFDEDDITYIVWGKYDLEEERYMDVANTEVFEAGVRYRCMIQMDNNGLAQAPAVTLNGNTLEDCLIMTNNGVPVGIEMLCVLGTPEPAPIAINGPDVVCAESNYFFTATASEGVTFDDAFVLENDIDGTCLLTLHQETEDTAWGVVKTYYYSAGSFELKVSGMTEDGTPVSATKTVQVSPEHIYVDGVCGCGAKLEYTITYDGGMDSEGSITAGTKTHGVNYTLSSKTFTREGYIQIGWEDKEGKRYDLGGTYTQDADMTFYPIWDEIITVTAPFTITVEQGGNVAPGNTDFELVLIDGKGNELTYDDEYFSAVVTTDGAGDYDGTLTITAPFSWLYDMLYEGAFIWQYDDEEEGWTYDDTVWGVRLYKQEIAARSVSDVQYSLLIYPAKNTSDDGFSFNLDMNAGTVSAMSFTNTYTNNATQPGDGTQDDGTTTAPSTGDNSSPVLWIALLAVSAAGMIAVGVYSKRRRSSKTK